MPFRFERLAIPDLVLIHPEAVDDDRGFLLEAYKYSDFAAFGIKERFSQDNHSRSTRGVLRGLHYQKKARAQGKLVRVVAGEIFDVAVDIRRRSPTFGRWVAQTLSAENRRMLYVPPGFAHGFCVVSDVTDVLYKLTDEHAPDQERGIAWKDPELKIAWPTTTPLLSPRDAMLPPLRAADNDF